MRAVLPDPYLPLLVREALVGGSAAPASGTVVSANLAIYVPVIFPCSVLLYSLGFRATSALGNYDLGIYDGASLNRLISAGSTAITAAGTKTLSIPNMRLNAGKLYFAALALSNGSDTIVRIPVGTAARLRYANIGQEASALPLPATMTPAQTTMTSTPWFAFGSR